MARSSHNPSLAPLTRYALVDMDNPNSGVVRAIHATQEIAEHENERAGLEIVIIDHAAIGVASRIYVR